MLESLPPFRNNWRVPRSPRICAALLLTSFLVGCAADSTQSRTTLTPPATRNYPPPAPRPVPPTVRQSVPPYVPPPPVVVRPPTPTIPPPSTFQPVTPTPPAPAPLVVVGQWVSLDSWSQSRGLGRPQHNGAHTNLFQVPMANGVLSFTAGSQNATWNGMKIPLGFAPIVTKGQMFLSTLDVQKTLQTLLMPMTLPARGARVVVIDPGHGGDNLGAKSVAGGKHEKDLALDWARRLKPLLEQRGWRVFLTRTGDTAMGLQERVTFADQLQANLFLSLHFNSGPANQSGLESYCTTPVGMASSITRDYKDDPNESFANNAWDTQNLQYTARLHRTLLNVLGEQDRGVRHARFMAVLRGQNRPAVLLEGGYLTNAAEARLISTPEHRQKLALAVARALE